MVAERVVQTADDLEDNRIAVEARKVRPELISHNGDRSFENIDKHGKSKWSSNRRESHEPEQRTGIGIRHVQLESAQHRQEAASATAALDQTGQRLKDMEKHMTTLMATIQQQAQAQQLQ